MAGQLCDSCEHLGDRCYCAPNSCCEAYEPMKRLNVNWYVYRHYFNENKIKPFNIFDHWKFNEDVHKELLICNNKAEFATKVRSHLFYYFCSKCEYEVLVSPWIGNREKGIIKIDIYDQVMMNFNGFVDHIWSSRGNL